MENENRPDLDAASITDTSRPLTSNLSVELPGIEDAYNRVDLRKY